MLLVFAGIAIVGCDGASDGLNGSSGKASVRGITIADGELMTDVTVPNINNKIMGYEDEFYADSVIAEPRIVPAFSGFVLVLPPSIVAEKGIAVYASYKNKEYKEILEVEKHEMNNVLLGYSRYCFFQNRFWINPDGKWTITVRDGKKTLLRTEYESTENALFCRAENDSPFVDIREREIRRGKDYTYRFRSRNRNVVVVYYSPDQLVYTPIATVKPTDGDTDVKLKIRWGKDAGSGSYYICNYERDRIPRTEEVLPLFDSIYLE